MKGFGEALKGNYQVLRGEEEVRPDALKGGGEELKGYRAALEGDEEALFNNGGMLGCDMRRFLRVKRRH